MAGNCETCGEHILDCQCKRRDENSDGSREIDMINSPPYYQGVNLEVIEVIEEFGLNFHLGNAIKYILRAGKKGDKIEDLKKAIWYLEREIAEDM